MRAPKSPESALAWRYLEASALVGIHAQSYAAHVGGTVDVEQPMVDARFLDAVEGIRRIDAAIAMLPAPVQHALVAIGEGRTWGPAMTQAFGRPSGLCLAGIAVTLPATLTAWRDRQVRQGEKRHDLPDPSPVQLRDFLVGRVENGDRKATAPIRAAVEVRWRVILEAFAQAYEAARDAA